MNAIFNSALKQSNQLRADLDNFASSPSTTSAAVQGQISTTLTSFSRTIDDYNETAKKELNHAKQEKAHERIKTFREELRDYRQRYADLKRDREEHLAAQNRSELLGRRPHAAAATPENPYAQATNHAQSAFAPSSSSSPYANGGGAGGGMSFGAGPQHATREGHALREQTFFEQGNQQLDEYLERGREVLSSLGAQKDMLKNTQRKLYSVANTLGVSGDTIRMVERRAKQDKWIFGAGVVVFFGFCWLVLHYLR